MCTRYSLALRAVVPHVSRVMRALVPHLPRILRAVVPHVPHVPRALLAFVSHVPVFYMLPCLTWLMLLCSRDLHAPCASSFASFMPIPHFLILFFHASRDFFLFISNSWIRITLMQIWESPYKFAFIQKQYPEHFAFLILTILESRPSEVCNFF